jgi:hypothetical protein
MKPQPSEGFCPAVVGKYHPIIVRKDGEEEPGPEVYGVYDDGEDYPCPYGVPGGNLWVRETFRVANGLVIYRADHRIVAKGIWKPSIFMERKHSRITLELTNVRVQRIQEISFMDAKAEGVECGRHGYVSNFVELWNSINAKRGYAWETNCYVWALSFKVVKP